MNYLQVVQVFSRIPNGPVLDMNQHSLKDWEWVLGVNLWGSRHGVPGHPRRPVLHLQPPQSAEQRPPALRRHLGRYQPDRPVRRVAGYRRGFATSAAGLDRALVCGATKSSFRSSRPNVGEPGSASLAFDRPHLTGRMGVLREDVVSASASVRYNRKRLASSPTLGISRRSPCLPGTRSIAKSFTRLAHP